MEWEDVRQEIGHHPRRVRPGLLLHPAQPGPPRGAALPSGDAVPSAGHGRAPVLRAAVRRRRYREDGHRQEVLRRHVRVPRDQRETRRYRIRELQELQRGRDHPSAHQALRQRVPGEGLLGGRDGPRPGAAPRRQLARIGRDPGRGGRSPEEGVHRSRLSADARPHGGMRSRIADNDLAGAHRPVPRRGLPLHIPQIEHRQVRQVQLLRAQGDRGRPCRGGVVPGHVFRRRPDPHSRGILRIRGRQDGHRTPGQGGEHRRGGRRGGDDRRARPRRQGDDIQFRIGLQASLIGHQQDAGGPGRRQGHEDEPVHPFPSRGEDVRHRVRGVRCAGQEAHAVLDLSPGPRQARSGEDQAHIRTHREDRHGIPSGHPVQGPGGEDGIHPGQRERGR